MKPEPELVVLNDGNTFAGAAGTYIIDTDGKVYDLESILMETPKAKWSRWRLKREDNTSLFYDLEDKIKSCDESFGGLQ